MIDVQSLSDRLAYAESRIILSTRHGLLVDLLPDMHAALEELKMRQQSECQCQGEDHDRSQ